MKTLTSICLALLCYIPFFVNAQGISYDDIEQTFVVSGLENPQPVGGSKNDSYWRYFWEFGDGHYSFNRSPQYCYSEPGTYTVRAMVTPYYSYESTRSFEKTITVTDADCNRPKTYPMGGLVNIETNASGELVPGHDIQVIIDYSMPFSATSSEGYLLFFYNSEQEKRDLKLDFYPISYKRNQERLYEAKQVPDFSLGSIPDYNLPDKGYLQGLMDDHQVRVFSCNLAPGANNRMFLSIGAASALDTTIIKGKKGALVTNLKVAWIPTGTIFNKLDMTDNYDLQMLSVHDPNRIRIEMPRGAAYFSGRNPETFRFKVEFQNKGGRPVRQVDIDIPWDDQFDYNQIEVIERDPADNAICPDCPPGFDQNMDSISCFQVDTTLKETEGIVRLTFYNVMIHGKNEAGVGGGKYTKGFVTYEVPSTKYMRSHSRVRADITFLGGETFRTGRASKKWKHRMLGLKLGRNFAGNLDGFDRLDADEDIKHWFNAGVYWRNTPVKRGIGSGWEISVAGMGFENQVLNSQRGFSSAFFEQHEFMEETIEMVTFDIQAQVEARIFGAFAAGVGAGGSFPLTATRTIQYNYLFFNDIANSPELAEIWNQPEQFQGEVFDAFLNFNSFSQQTVESTFGLFQNNEEALFVGDREVISNKSLGMVFHWYLEAGLLNYGNIGIRQDFRFYPNAYQESCLKLNNLELYLKIKLASFK